MSLDVQAGHGTATLAHEAHLTGPHASRRAYLTGFALSVLLTAIPFWLVMAGALPRQATAVAIAVLAVTQIVVHMIYFLHMDPRVEGGWSLLALIFTLILVLITLTGSLWVMYHLRVNMMPLSNLGQMP